MISARSWNALRRPPTATAWTNATCRSSCGPGSRTTTPSSLSFYNYPYAFGLLFATGLYAIYQQRGPAFVGDYKKLLAATGEATRPAWRSASGSTCGTRKFWDDSLAIVGRQVDLFCRL